MKNGIFGKRKESNAKKQCSKNLKQRNILLELAITKKNMRFNL